MHTAPVRTLIRQFIDTRLGPNDMAAILTVRGGPDAMQGFTSSRRLLLRAVNHFTGGQFGSEVPAERTSRINASLLTLSGAADFLAAFHGRRKALIHVSEGLGFDVYNIRDDHYSGYMAIVRDAIAATTRADASIYTIDPQGLPTPGDTAAETPPPLDLGPRFNRVDPPTTQDLEQQSRASRESLRYLAAETGGFAMVNSNDFGGAFDRIVADNSSYYLLGFYPTNGRREGKVRQLQVKVRRPGVQVTARSTYVEPRGRPAIEAKTASVSGTSAALVEALNGELPVPGLTLAATAAAFKGTRRDASVAVVIEARGGDLHLAAENGKYTGRLELSAWAFDQHGTFKAGERPTVNFGLGPETYAALKQFGVNVLTRLTLPPGRYQLRVGALRNETGALGTVFYDLDVPDFSKGALAMSGVLLASIAASRAVVPHPDALLASALPAAPTTMREFPEGDGLAAFAEVYDNEGTAHTVDITTTVLNASGAVVYTNVESHQSTERDGKLGGYPHTARISLADLRPGSYFLRVEAQSRPGGADPVMREVPFRIRTGAR